ncbi:extracellular solute-binding protein [Promicromonospora sp. NPDC050262]|uniref:extracellular solute-binding protein n=1 Tax=Promicromonospora sp. NPDC050262 TaxID=3155036 RepID=UPI0033E8D4DB
MIKHRTLASVGTLTAAALTLAGAEGVAAALPRLLTAGDAPDVVQSMPPTVDLAPELVDLSQYDWATGGPLADQYSIDGKYYMAGIGFQLQSLWFYNKTAFEEAGITETPGTVEELTAALGKLKDAGWTPIQTGGDWMTSHSLQAAARYPLRVAGVEAVVVGARTPAEVGVFADAAAADVPEDLWAALDAARSAPAPA